MSSSSGYSNGLPPRASSVGPYYHRSTAGSENISRGDFQMMDITVSVLGLTGITMQAKKRKDGMKDIVMKSTLSASDSMSAESTSTQGTDELNMPVAALASFYKNVTNSDTSIASHMPSLPLRAPSSDINNEKYQYTATWPTDFDPSGNELSTFKCSRLMRKELLSSNYNPREDSVSSVVGFVPEKMQLKIGLRQGSEIITLGSAKILITGEESDDIHVSLPINTTKAEEKEVFGGKIKKSKSKLFSKSSTKSKKLKPVSFTKGPRRKYILDDNASLNVLIRVVPSHHNPKSQTYPTIDYNSVPEVLHVGAESDSSGESLSYANFATRRSRSVSRSMTHSEDYQCVDGGHRRSEEKMSTFKREPRHTIRSGSESRRIIRSGNRSVTHSEPCIQYSGRRNLRSCENTMHLREIDEARSHENIDLDSVTSDHQSSYDRYESHYDDIDNISEESVVENPYPKYNSEPNVTRFEQTKYVDEIETRRSVDKPVANLKQGHTSRLRNNVVMRTKPVINGINPEPKSPVDNLRGLFFGSSSIFRCGDMMSVLSENERKVYTKEVQSDENHMQYEANPIPADSFDNDSDGDVSTMGMSYGNTGKSHGVIENDSVFETYYPAETQMPDEYTCATEPTDNKYRGSKIMREDKAMNMIHNYASRVGVHPTKMV